MRFLTKLSKEYFRWPAARTLRIYAYLALFLTATSTLEAFFRVTTRQDILHGFAVAGLNIVACALLSLTFLLLWGIYYRLLTGFVQGLTAFVRALPGAWYSFRRSLSRLASALESFAYGVVDFFAWLRDLPANWRRKDSKQKADVVISTSIFAIWIGSTAALYPFAHRLSAASPRWMPMSDAPFLQTVFYDLLLGCGAMICICLAISLVLCALHYATRGRKA